MLINKFRNVTCFLAFMTCQLIAAPVSAEELAADLSQLGTMTFGAGNLPPAGSTVLGGRLVIYDFNKIADTSGGMRTPLKTLNATAVGGALALLHMTNLKFLGADYGFQVVLPYLDASADSTISAGPQTINAHGHFSDLLSVVATPIVLQWRDPDRVFNQNFILDVPIPIGTYQGTNALNAATDAYAIRPKYTFTYLNKNGYELTAAASVEYSFKNRHEDYKTGVIGALNFAAGKHIGPFTTGISGYALKQFNGDQAGGVLAPDGGRKARVYALGPVISYRDPANFRSPVISVKYLREFAAQNRSQGTSLWIVAAYPL